MDIDFWIAALRITIVLLAVSVIWPNLLDVRRWQRRFEVKADTRRVAR